MQCWTGGERLDLTGAVLLAGEITEQVARLIDCAIDNGTPVKVCMNFRVGAVNTLGNHENGPKILTSDSH